MTALSPIHRCGHCEVMLIRQRDRFACHWCKTPVLWPPPVYREREVFIYVPFDPEEATPTWEDYEMAYVKGALAVNGGDVLATAKETGIGKTTLVASDLRRAALAAVDGAQ